MKYFLIAGEASGDLHAGNLIKHIKELDKNACFAFMGGDNMKLSSSAEPVVHYKDMAFMGFFNVLKNLKTIKKNARKVQSAIIDFNPDVVIPVDYSGFVFRYILRFTKTKTNAKIVYFIAPKLWAWKKWRISKIKKYVDSLLCILPFEEDFFKSNGFHNAHYVGNPCCNAVDESYRHDLSCLFENKQIAVLPGSRKQEITDNLDIVLQALSAYSYNYRIVIALAPSIDIDFLHNVIKKYPFVDVDTNDTYNTLKNSSFAVVTSGTATLETAIIGIPQVVVYRMNGNPLLRLIFKYFFPIKFISLVNIILQKRVVAELICDEVSTNRLRDEIDKALEKNRADILEGYSKLRKVLADKDCLKNSAQIIYDIVK